MVSCLHILAHTLDTRLVQILVLTLKIKGDQFSHFQVYVFSFVSHFLYHNLHF